MLDWIDIHTVSRQNLPPFCQSDSYWIWVINVWIFVSQLNSHFYWSQNQLRSIQTDTCVLSFCACSIYIFEFTHPIKHFPFFFLKEAMDVCRLQEIFTKNHILLHINVSNKISELFLNGICFSWFLAVHTPVISYFFHLYIRISICKNERNSYMATSMGSFYIYKKLIRWKNIKTNLKLCSFLLELIIGGRSASWRAVLISSF